MCYIARMSVHKPLLRQSTHLEQFEFSFAPQVTVEMRVDRLDDGRVLLTPSAEVTVWCSTQDAADELGKSRQWVLDALAAKLLRGEKVGKCWRVDRVYLQELRKRGRNF